MPFTPNMPQSQVSELDRRRGHGDVGTYTNPDRVEAKRPWDKDAKKSEHTDEHEEEKMNQLMGKSVTAQAIDILKGCVRKSSDKKIEELLEYEKEEHGGKIPSPADEAAECDEKTSKAIALLKALSTRSGIITPRPYNPNESYANATRVPVSPGAARESSPQGRAPLETYDSCVVHGLIHKSSAGCHLCNVQKAMMCKNCGTTLQKMRGGEYACPSHG